MGFSLTQFFIGFNLVNDRLITILIILLYKGIQRGFALLIYPLLSQLGKPGDSLKIRCDLAIFINMVSD
jgi:hypothetical protein